MTSAPLVSVITATYRPQPAWLAASLNSALEQTVESFEVLVMDDEHQPETHALVDGISDPRVRYLPGPRRGPAANHALGIAQPRSPLIAVLNQDDLWEPELLATLLEPIRSDRSVVVSFGDHWVIDDQGAVDEAGSEACSQAWGRTDLSAGVYRPFGHLALCRGTIPLAQAAIFSRECVDGLLPAWAGPWYDRYLRPPARGR